MNNDKEDLVMKNPQNVSNNFSNDEKKIYLKSDETILLENMYSHFLLTVLENPYFLKLDKLNKGQKDTLLKEIYKSLSVVRDSVELNFICQEVKDEDLNLIIHKAQSLLTDRITIFEDKLKSLEDNSND